jgi:tripartite-type tricarboxylate transporter receptor subunit TctC
VARLSDTLRKVLEQKDVQDALVRANSLAAWQTAQEYRAGVEADRRMYSDLLPAIGVRGN